MAIKYEICNECKECIKNHINKKGEFKVKCTPLPKELMDSENPIYPLEKMLGKEIFDSLDESDKIDIQLSKNKLMWAKEMLNWGTYNAERKFDQFYQRLMLSCTAKLKTMRLGRRMGKSEVVIVDALQYAITNPGKTVLIIGPFQNLIDEIFDRLAKMLDSPMSAFGSGYERKRQPNVIRLPNGSQIKGFTTGMNGDSIRGQSGDRIYFDEASYIPSTAFRSVLALLMDNPNVCITATSTPSAIETKFKDWCLLDPLWKEFHYPSTILPYFKDLESSIKSSYTKDDYSLEVLAEFIEGSSRVFKSVDIKDAQEEYAYIDSRMELERPNDWIISLGVDYNEYRNGIQLVVVGFNKRATSGKPFKVLKRITLDKSSYNDNQLKDLQSRGVELIKELYMDFQLDHIYVDEGHGSMQNEVLAKYFHDIGEPFKFKGIDFSSMYEYEDFYTNEIKRKRKKVMMVNFLQKRFEMKEIIYSKLEEQDKGLLTTQLTNYNIKGYDSKDQPIFEGEDHIIDGLMLGVFAIVENYDSLFDKKTGNFIGTIHRELEGNFVENEFEREKKKPKLPSNVETFEAVTGTYSIKKKKRRGGGYNFNFI